MYKITISEKVGRVFPDDDPDGRDENYLHNYEDSHIADLASTLGVNAVIGDSVFTLGDSKITIKIEFTGKQGNPGMREFEKYVKDLIEYMKTALPLMSGDYRSFYDHFIKDYEKNGLQMPHWS